MLADVIYYYKGVITAQVTTPPLEFYSGASFTYCPSPGPSPGGSPPGPGGPPSPPSPPPTPPPPPCTYKLNSLVPGYASFKALPTGFTATIQLTNASYAQFYHALGLVVKTSGTSGWLYVTNVTTSGNDIIKTMTITVQSASTGQTVCSFTVISNSKPITSPTTACPLSTGPYFISVLVQPVIPLSPSQSENVTLYFGYNVVSHATVPLPPISG
ncbi:MAG: hypothetical protein RXR44_05145 [Vulcanisaeta sp.]